MKILPQASTSFASLTNKRKVAVGHPFDWFINFPTGLLTFVFTCVALGMLIFLSLRINDSTLLGHGITVENFRQLVADPLYATVLGKSLMISALVTLATVILAYPMAYFISLASPAWRGRLLFIVTLPFWTSYLLRVFSWKIILGYNGILNSGLVGLGFIKEPLAFLLYTPTAMVITLAHAYAAFAVLPIYVCLSSINRNLVEAARDLGANGPQLFLRVILPLSFPGIAAASAVVFIPTLGDYVTPILVGGPAGTMIGNLIQAQFGKADNWPLGAALALFTMVVVLLLFVLRNLTSDLHRRLSA
ncbi:ABC transporter permease [Paraburkholderia sp. GAS334]|uniref:ABC transporter permease n=1 Tax=Paraburkholderia sp. GAS334 TaxID=3035131 RepID=UPI003D1B478E